MWLPNRGSNSISVIDGVAGGPPRYKVMAIPVPGLTPEGLDLSPDGRELWTATRGDGAVSIIDTATRRVKQSFGLRLTDAFIAAAVRCAPPGNKPTPEEINNCLTHLDAETAALPHVRVVVGLGKIAFDAYLQLLMTRNIVARPRPQFGHASVATLPNRQTLIGCYHPSRQNTNTGKLTSAMMNRVFRMARSHLS